MKSKNPFGNPRKHDPQELPKPPIAQAADRPDWVALITEQDAQKVKCVSATEEPQPPFFKKAGSHLEKMARDIIGVTVGRSSVAAARYTFCFQLPSGGRRRR